MNFRSLLESYLVERNPGAEYSSPKDLVKKYPSDDFHFVRFVEPWKVGDKEVSKVGINTKSGWGNPRGVYAYWLSDFKEGKNADFATDYKTLFIIKRKDFGLQIEDIGNLARNTYMDLIEKLKDYIKRSVPSYSDEAIDKIFIDFLKNTESRTNNKSDGGILFYLVYRLGQGDFFSNLFLDIPTPKDFNSFEFFPGSTSDIKQTFIWRKILGVTFIGDKGHGIIHPSEASQALFLDPRAWEVIDQMDNKKYEGLRAARSSDEKPDEMYFRGPISGLALAWMHRKYDLMEEIISSNYHSSNLTYFVLDKILLDGLFSKSPWKNKPGILKEFDTWIKRYQPTDPNSIFQLLIRRAPYFGTNYYKLLDRLLDLWIKYPPQYVSQLAQVDLFLKNINKGNEDKLKEFLNLIPKKLRESEEWEKIKRTLIEYTSNIPNMAKWIEEYLRG